MEDNTYKILWTGGWDSTFRLLQLAKQEIIIQPYYIFDISRKSNIHEQVAMKKILKQINANPKFKAAIKPVILYDKQIILNDFKDEKVSNSYKYLKEKYNIGSQYEWFALLAKKTGFNFDLCIESCRRSKATCAVLDEGVLIDGVLDKNKSSKEVLDVFGYAIFPIITYTKTEIKNMSKKEKWDKIMKLTWFCHHPMIFNLPCGKCNPCKDIMNENMSYRMPVISKIMYWLSK